MLVVAYELLTHAGLRLRLRIANCMPASLVTTTAIWDTRRSSATTLLHSSTECPDKLNPGRSG